MKRSLPVLCRCLPQDAPSTGKDRPQTLFGKLETPPQAALSHATLVGLATHFEMHLAAVMAREGVAGLPRVGG